MLRFGRKSRLYQNPDRAAKESTREKEIRTSYPEANIVSTSRTVYQCQAQQKDMARVYVCLTSSSFRPFWKNEAGVVARHWLKAEIGVPVVVRLFLLSLHLGSIHGFAVLGADGIDLVIRSTVISFGIENGVDVKAASAWPSCKLTQPHSKCL